MFASHKRKKKRRHTIDNSDIDSSSSSRRDLNSTRRRRQHDAIAPLPDSDLATPPKKTHVGLPQQAPSRSHDTHNSAGSGDLAVIKKKKQRRLTLDKGESRSLFMGKREQDKATSTLPDSEASAPSPNTKTAKTNTDSAGLPQRVSRLEALDLAGTSNIDRRELLRRVVDVEDTSSLAFILDALQTINDPTPFSEKRRQELKGLAGKDGQAHLAEQMGLRTARNQREPKSGFEPQHPKSSTYLRTDLGSPEDKLNLLYDKLGADRNDYPVNSDKVLDRLRLLMSEEDLGKLSIRKADTGRLYFLRVKEGVTLSPSVDLKKLLHDVGATPSPYLIYKLLDGQKLVPIDINVNPKRQLQNLIKSPPFTRVKVLARTSKQKAMYGVIVHLLEGLNPNWLQRSNPLISNAIANLERLTRIAVASDLDSDTLATAIDLMMDELMVVLGSGNHYDNRDFEKAVSKLENDRSPALAELLNEPGVMRDHYYASSGMDAISTALTLALDQTRGHIARITEDLDYFELSILLAKLKLGKVVEYNDANILLAALHPSTPYKTQNIAELADKITGILKSYKSDKPLSLVLDTTIETGSDELNQLWKALSPFIKEGMLNVFTAKSYHKYATLGTGKLSAGATTVVGRFLGLPTSATWLHNKALDFADSPEAQLMTHILTHAAEDEITLIKNAAANTKFVSELCWPSGDHRDSKFAPGIPLLFRAMGGKDVRPFVELLNIEKRDSFSFLQTSFVPIPGFPDPSHSVRLNPGQESKEAMVEFFYALGHLALNRKPGEASKSSLAEISMDAIFAHLKALEKLDGESPEAPYTNNVRASYLYFATQFLKERSEANSDLLEQLGNFIDKRMMGVTRSMQAQLSTQYLELWLRMLDENLITDETLLNSAKRAALLVSPTNVPRIEKQLASLTRIERAIEPRPNVSNGNPSPPGLPPAPPTPPPSYPPAPPSPPGLAPSGLLPPPPGLAPSVPPKTQELKTLLNTQPPSPAKLKSKLGIAE